MDGDRELILKKIDATGELYNSNNYVRTGTQVILHTNDEYYKLFPEKLEMIWNHHMFEAYYFLLNGTIVPMHEIKN